MLHSVKEGLKSFGFPFWLPSYFIDLENIVGCAAKRAVLLLQNKVIFSFLVFSYLWLGLKSFCPAYLFQLMKKDLD